MSMRLQNEVNELAKAVLEIGQRIHEIERVLRDLVEPERKRRQGAKESDNDR